MTEQACLVKTFFALSMAYHLVLMVLKAAFLLQYRRSFPLPDFQRLCDICLIILACWAIASAVATGIVEAPGQEDRKASFQVWLAHGILNIVTDVFIFIMPLPLINTLPLSVGQKCILVFVFALGFLTCVISILRLAVLHDAMQSPDPSYSMAKISFWSIGEATSAIVCLCIPTLRPLLSSFGGQTLRETRLGSSSAQERRIKRAAETWAQTAELEC